MKLKNIYLIFMIIYTFNLINGDGILFWYDTTQNRNNDFRMDSVPDDTYNDDVLNLQKELGPNGNMVYNKGQNPILATFIQDMAIDDYLKNNSNIDFSIFNYYDNAKISNNDFDDNGDYDDSDDENESEEKAISNNIVLVKNENSFNQWTDIVDPSVTLKGSVYFQFNQSSNDNNSIGTSSSSRTNSNNSENENIEEEFSTINGTVYYNDQFFPLDGLGFGEYEQDNKLHNYYWCVKLRFLSKVPMDEKQLMILKLSTSDDKFVYVNDKLIYSYIGITRQHEKKIIINKVQDIDYYGYYNGKEKENNYRVTEIKEQLLPGENFVVDIINCNRKDRDNFHLFSIKSNFKLFCE